MQMKTVGYKRRAALAAFLLSIILILGSPPVSTEEATISAGTAPEQQNIPTWPHDRMPVPFRVEVDDGERWGYRYADDSVAIPPRYIIALEFQPEGTAAVAAEDGWAIIDSGGEVLLRPFVVNNGPDNFSEGLARFVEGGKLGFFDRAGDVVISAQYDGARAFSEGLAAVCVGCRRKTAGEHGFWVGGRWGYVDRSGHMVISVRFGDAGWFENGRAEVQIGDQRFWIDHEGCPVMRRDPGNADQDKVR